MEGGPGKCAEQGQPRTGWHIPDSIVEEDRYGIGVGSLFDVHLPLLKCLPPFITPVYSLLTDLFPLASPCCLISIHPFRGLSMCSETKHVHLHLALYKHLSPPFELSLLLTTFIYRASFVSSRP